MLLNKIKLECPRCHWIFEVTPPDGEHLACSLEKPARSRILNEIIEVNLVCRNPRCKEPITVYSYMPIDFFNRL